MAEIYILRYPSRRTQRLRSTTLLQLQRIAISAAACSSERRREGTPAANRRRQVSFLHVFHHSSITLVTALAVQFDTSGDTRAGARAAIHPHSARSFYLPVGLVFSV
jgi:hypothetical protein